MAGGERSLAFLAHVAESGRTAGELAGVLRWALIGSAALRGGGDLHSPCKLVEVLAAGARAGGEGPCGRCWPVMQPVWVVQNLSH